jgi:hypothetical protein
MVARNELVESFVEIRLPVDEETGERDPRTFLKIKETLTRIGVASKKEQALYQSCHILHKQGRYFIVHFKEMFMLDGKDTNFSEEDRGRRNTIANLLADWGLVELVDTEKSKAPLTPISQIKVLHHDEKPDWSLVQKYTFS